MDWNRRRLMEGLLGVTTLNLTGCAPWPMARAQGPSNSEAPFQRARPNHPDRRPTTNRAPTPLPRGFERLRWSQDGLERESLLYVPPASDAPRPLLVAIHGNNGSAHVMYGRHALADLVRDQGWFGLFPETDVWLPDDPQPDVGDHRYLSRVLDAALAAHPIDPSRVFVVGFSGGGKKAYLLAAQSSDRIAGIAVCGSRIGHRSGASAANWDPRTSGALPLSILHIHGRRDARVNPDGGPDDRHPGMTGVGMIEGLELWATHMGATEQVNPKIPEACPSRARARLWSTPDGQRVVGVLDPELGHTWPDYMNDAVMRFIRNTPPRVLPAEAPL